MLKDLATFFADTDGGRVIPRNLKPGIVRNVSRSLLGHGGKIIAECKLPDGTFYQVCQLRQGSDMWMEAYRSDGTLLQQQSYHPFAKAYAMDVTNYNETGKRFVNYRAFANDGRCVESVSRTDDDKLERMIYQYSDLHGIGQSERTKYGRDIRCHHTTERRYRDYAGTSIDIDTHFGPDQHCTHEVHYDETTQKMFALIEFQPGRRTHKLVTTFDQNGIKDSEMFYNKEGTTTRYVEYYTEGVPKEKESELKTKVEWSYSNGIQQRETQYRPDGTLRLRREYESDGKTTKNEQFFNTSGEYAYEIREYSKGKLTRKLEMHRPGEDVEVKRIILYSDGKPYRSREHHRWDTTNDDFWADTEIDPKTGFPSFTIMSPPSGGLTRHHYDPKTGRLQTTDRHREEGLGETLESRTHYHPAPTATRHPEANTPSVVRRKEHYEDDGHTLHDARDFRTDGTIKSDESHESDGSWTRRVYAPGTQEIKDDVTPIYESTHRADGTKESSTLRAHTDPAIIAMHKFYDEHGKPERVQIEGIDGEETLRWEEYVKRRQQERRPPNLPSVTLATISPDIRDTDSGQDHYGQTVITLQGTEAALEQIKRRIEQYLPQAQTELFTGKKQLLQFRNLTGRYIENSPDVEANPLVEKVNVLTVIMPYREMENDSWPQHFSPESAGNDVAKALTKRGIEDASRALNMLCHQSNCDLGLNFHAEVTSQKDKQGHTQYYPYVVVSWSNKPYLPEAQCEVIHHMLSQKMRQHQFLCTHIPGQNSLEVFVSQGAPNRENACQLASSWRNELHDELTPASLRKHEPEKQL